MEEEHLVNQSNSTLTRFEKLKVLSRLTVQELEAIQQSFPIILFDSVEERRDADQFCELLSCIIPHGNEDEFRELFDVIDTDKEGFVDWDKFCSHLQRDYQEKDDRMKTTQVPQWREVKYTNSPHKENIQKITMLKNPPRYLTVSKEGVAVVWNLNMKPLRTIRITTEPDDVKQRDLWITDFAAMQNVYKLVVAMTSKEIAIYELSSKSEFLCLYRIRGLKSTPISLNFWSNPDQPNESILVFGDVAGYVNALIFCESTISLFDRPAQSSANQQDITFMIDIADITKGHYKNCRHIYHHGHSEWTRQVMYTSVLDCFISCATNYKNALVLGWMEKNKSTMRTTVFKISQGVNAFDYNDKMNLIATAGVNHHVLLWNPYVISKPVGVLRGHMQSVIAVKFIRSRGQIISLSKDKVLRVWDTHLQVCLQRLSGMFPKGPEISTVLYFDEERSTLLTGFNRRVAVMVMKPEVKDRILSHEHPVTAAIYNRKFSQVVSACAGSVVTMWMIDTGQKVKQFTSAHGNSEITTLTQDASETRLFTGSTDGTVKIWDFNGHCHHVLVAGDGSPCDITQILPLKRMILVVGWDRTLCVFRDSQLTSYYVHPSDWKGRQEHQDDIQCMSFTPPHTLATASYDGELVLWNTSSEQAFRHFNCKAHKDGRASRRQRKLERANSALSQARGKSPVSLTTGDAIEDDFSKFLSAENEKEENAGYFVNNLIFLYNRPPPAVQNEAADLVSCGANGWVRFWNTADNSLAGEFIAHDHAGAITMAVDGDCRYLATGDGDGFVKVYIITEYCVSANVEGTSKMPPPLHRQFQPHFDAITSLEIILRFDRMLLLTSSNDSSLALWDIHGRQLGVFGQEKHWKIEDLPVEQPENENDESNFLAKPNEDEMKDIDSPYVNEERPNVESQIPEDWDPTDSTWDSSILGKSFSEPRKQKRQRRQQVIGRGKLTDPENGKLNSTGLTYGTLRTEELSAIHNLQKPDFVSNPSKYFSDDFMNSRKSSPSNIENLPHISETISMRYDEKNLFPKYILDMDMKMRALHAIETHRSRANTRAAGSSRSKISTAGHNLLGKNQPLRKHAQRWKLSTQHERGDAQKPNV